VAAVEFGGGEAVPRCGASLDFAVADEGAVHVETAFGGIVAGLAESEDVAGAAPAFGQERGEDGLGGYAGGEGESAAGFQAAGDGLEECGAASPST
jgi:hypothetical protein